jgi:hypothetical protein
MNKLKKGCFLLVLFTAAFAGCQSPISSSSGKSTAPQKSSSKPIQNMSGNSVSNIEANFAITPGSLVDPGAITSEIKASLVIQSGNLLYYSNWSDGDKLYKMNLDGTGSKKIVDDSVSELLLSNNIIYYANESDQDKMYTINIDGTGRKKLLDERAYNLDLLGNLIYYIDSNSNIATLNISSGKKISLNLKSRCFDSDGTYIYYEDYSLKHVLSSVKVDGSNYGRVSEDFPMNIASQSGVAYYINGWDNNKIYKISSDGSSRIKLNDYRSSNLTLDNGWIYYINNSDYDKIYKIKVDGSSSTIVSSESFVKNFNIAGNYIFFDKNTDINHPIYKTNK